MSTDRNGDLLMLSGGYRRLKSFQLAQLIYDITVRFVELTFPKKAVSFLENDGFAAYEQTA